MKGALWLVAALLAAPAVAEAPPAPAPFDVKIDVPQDKPQQVNMLLRTFPIGSGSGWHVHPGDEIAYMLDGEMMLEQAGEPVRRLVPGDSFAMPRGRPHNGINIGTVPARLVITYVTDSGAPQRKSVEAPGGH